MRFILLRDHHKFVFRLTNSYSSSYDFLNFTDVDFMSKDSGNSPLLNDYIHKIQRREIFKRSAVIGIPTIESSSRPNFDKLISISGQSDALKNLRKLITASMNLSDFKHHEIWIDLPLNPSLRELTMFEVEIAPGEVVKIGDLSKAVYGRLLAHAQIAWRGYAFAFPENRKSLFDATITVLESYLGIKPNKFASILAKVPS